MLPLHPLCPLTAAKVAGLKATVALLLMLLIKSKLLRLKMSLLGSLIAFSMLASFLLTTGLLTVVAAGGVILAGTRGTKVSASERGVGMA